jgi:hypothetical protein
MTITLRIHTPHLEKVAAGTAELAPAEVGHVVRELLVLRAQAAERATILARIERNARQIYEASTYTSVTQARLRSIQADVDVLGAL